MGRIQTPRGAALVMVPIIVKESVEGLRDGLDEGALAIQLPSVSLSQSVRTTTQVERVLRNFPEVTKAVSKTGRAEVATDPMSVDFSDLYIALKPLSIAELAETAHRVASGDLDARVSVNRRDEVGRLAITFNDRGHEIEA